MQLTLAYNINEDVPSAMEKSPNRLQQDELLWYQGNPELKNTLNRNANFQYLWLISNKWQIAAGAYTHGLIIAGFLIIHRQSRRNNVETIYQQRQS